MKTELEKKHEKLDILKNDLIENLDHELEDNYSQFQARKNDGIILHGYRHLRSDIKQLESEIAALKQRGEPVSAEKMKHKINSLIIEYLHNEDYKTPKATSDLFNLFEEYAQQYHILESQEMKEMGNKKIKKHTGCSDYLLHKECPMFEIEGYKACEDCDSAI